jgi:hypothetical protein
VFINDRFPRAVTETGELQQRRDLKIGTDTGLSEGLYRFTCNLFVWADHW